MCAPSTDINLASVGNEIDHRPRVPNDTDIDRTIMVHVDPCGGLVEVLRLFIMNVLNITGGSYL